MKSVWEEKLEYECSALRKFDLHYLKTITKNFSIDQILGHGGYGIVYKGEHENGELVAVKKLITSRGVLDDKKFLNEVKNVMGIFHPNIVRLEGYCYQIQKVLIFYDGQHRFADEEYRLLCFEYLPNGSLDGYLSDESSRLDWHTRYSIIEGICMGLFCLHEGREGAPILHLDLKPSNILLDKNMTPKISDFGLSRLLFEGETHIWNTDKSGSSGYMAPEYIDRSILSKESDIFSLGVIIIQIMTGQRKYPEGTSCEEFTEVYAKWRTRLQSSSNEIALEEECRQVDQCIQVGLKCMKKDPDGRPNIREIVKILKKTECSVSGDSSDGKRQRRKLVHHEWRERIDCIVSGSAEQSIEALKAIGGDIYEWTVDICYLPKYIIEDADSLVSSLTSMVQKTFSSNTAGYSSRDCKCTLDIIMKVVQIKHLVRAVKSVTLQKLVTEMLIWLSSEEVLKMADGSQLLNSLDVVVFKILKENADRVSLFVILVNLLRPLDPSRGPSCTPLELLVVKNTIFSELVEKYTDPVNEEARVVTINDLDLDLILQCIHAFLERIGEEDIKIRVKNDDKPVMVVVFVLVVLVELIGSKIKGHLSMVPIEAEPKPVILTFIDCILERLAAKATTSVPPIGQTSHGGDAASKSGWLREIWKVSCSPEY